MEWRSYRDEDDVAVEELGAWLMTLAPFARSSVLGDIDALRGLAAEGKLVDGDKSKLEGFWDDPVLFELKWTLLSKKVRQYHAEPRSNPDLLVDLHIHIKKVVTKDRSQTKLLQQAEMRKAKLRYRVGEPHDWK